MSVSHATVKKGTCKYGSTANTVCMGVRKFSRYWYIPCGHGVARGMTEYDTYVKLSRLSEDEKYLHLSALNEALQDQNLAWGGDEGSSNVVHSNWLWLCFFFLHYWEGQVFAVLLPVCTFYHKWHYLSKYISGCHTTQWIPRLSSRTPEALFNSFSESSFSNLLQQRSHQV